MMRDAFNARVVAAARSWIGTPYHHQQSVRRAGVDCLGLIRGVWRDVCGEETEPVPNYSSSWKRGGEDILLDALHRHLDFTNGLDLGCVLAFRYRPNQPVTHLGILTTPTTMVHAYHGRGALEVPVSNFWRRKLDSAFEFPLVR